MFLSVSRSPSLVDLEDLDELGSIFGITIGKTDVDEMEKILRHYCLMLRLSVRC